MDRLLMRERLRAEFAEAVLVATVAEPLFERSLRVLATGLRADMGCVIGLEASVDRVRPRFHAELGLKIDAARAGADWTQATEAVVREGEVLFSVIEPGRRTAELPDAFREKGCAMVVALPVRAAPGAVGAIWLGFAEPLELTDDARRFAESVVETLGVGLSRLKKERTARRFRQCVNNLRDGILVMRSDGRLLDANDTAVGFYGYTREELFDRSILDLRAGSTLPEVLWQMRRAGMTGLVFETTHRRKDGSLFRCEVRSSGAMIDGEHLLISLIRPLEEPTAAPH